jgi:hypothetical protein
MVDEFGEVALPRASFCISFNYSWFVVSILNMSNDEILWPSQQGIDFSKKSMPSRSTSGPPAFRIPRFTSRLIADVLPS